MLSNNKLKTALAGTAAGAAMLLGFGIAPVQAGEIDGVVLPSGGTLISDITYETEVTAAGQTLTGVGEIGEIVGSNGVPTYTYGENGEYLTFDFTATSSYVLAPTATSAGYIEFSGLTAGVYEETSAPVLSGANVAQDVANASSGTFFLGLTAQPFTTNLEVQMSGGPATTELEAEISNDQSLSNFSNATGGAFLDATSGPAESAFATCSYTDALAGGSCPAGEVDTIFGEQISSTVAGGFAVSGTGSVKADIAAVPEPLSLAMFGAGLLGLGFVVRRRRDNRGNI